MEQVVLVNERDEETGTAEKLHAHEQGLLHRAISVFIYSSEGKLLLQQRANGKYHSAGLWTNTCCSHPRPGETPLAAAGRRLREEMGISTELKHVGELLYRAEFGNGLIEHEYDHLFTGVSDDIPTPDPNEVQSYKWVFPEELQSWMHEAPEEFTYWFRVLIEKGKLKLKRES